VAPQWPKSSSSTLHSPEDARKALLGWKLLGGGRTHDSEDKADNYKHDRQVAVIFKSNLSIDASQFELMPEGATAPPTQTDHGGVAAVLTPAVESVLSCMQQNTVTVTKKICCARRNINAKVANAVSHRIRFFRNDLQEIDLSHNPLGMSGLLEVILAIHDAHNIERLNLGHCELELARHLYILQNLDATVLPEMEAMSVDVEVVEEENDDDDDNDAVQSQHGSEAHLPPLLEMDTRVSFINSDGQELIFAPLHSGSVFQAPDAVPLPKPSSIGSEEDDGGGLADTQQAALRFKEFLLASKKLTYLNLTSNKLGVGGAWLLAQAALSETGFSLTLHHLDVSNSLMGLRDAGKWLQQVLVSCKVLETLNVSNNSIRSADACDVIEGMRGCPTLKEAYLAHNGFGEDAPAAALGNLLKSGAAPLRILDLRFNKFTGCRVGPWPKEYTDNDALFAHVLRILDTVCVCVCVCVCTCVCV